MVKSMASSAKSGRTIQFALLALLILGGALAVYSIFDSADKVTTDRTSQSLLTELQSEIYDLLVHSQSASQGNLDSIALLPDLGSQISKLQQQFNASETELETSERKQISGHIQVINENISIVEDRQKSVSFLNEQLEILQSSIPQVQQTYTTVVDTMLRSGVPSDQAVEAQAQVFRSERLLNSLTSILIGDSDPIAAAEQFRQDTLVFNQVLVGMKEGNLILGITRVESADTRLLLDQIETDFTVLNQSIQSFIDAAPALADISDAGERIRSAAATLQQTISTVSTQITALPSRRGFSTQTTILGALAVLVGVFGLVLLSFRSTKANLKETADRERITDEANQANQDAILRLLDEIADLGEGDLTVKATVTEDFTGAIADSINFAVEQLRDLVSNVANTAEAVSASSNETRSTSIRLSEASEHQARQITEASTSINEISGNLSKVSEDAEELAEVARSSVSMARNGAEVVQNTIDGMNNIREQIQDTSKRIKRLGESSQEIGDIVSLINEIADQTNILALNASIQAAMAGEAGRGFAVVADEVQGLAERAASSTKQIESLVKTIQSDTNEAVASMEQTTAEVVRGAQLANDAGSALNEIQSTSENLAKLILTIATETQGQAVNANRIVGTMKVIQDISSETLEGTTSSAHAVGELTEQAQSLRDSIADFKLPDHVSGGSPFDNVATLTDEDTSGIDELLSSNPEEGVSDFGEISDSLVESSSEVDAIEELLNEDLTDNTLAEEMVETATAPLLDKTTTLAEDDVAASALAESTDIPSDDYIDQDTLDELERSLTSGEADVAAASTLQPKDDGAKDNTLDIDEDFSFSDEDFLTFDLDENDKKS